MLVLILFKNWFRDAYYVSGLITVTKPLSRGPKWEKEMILERDLKFLKFSLQNDSVYAIQRSQLFKQKVILLLSIQKTIHKIVVSHFWKKMKSIAGP